jgi:hypothetical protein
MKSMITFIVSLISISSFAHIEPGTWTGKTSAGAECSFEAFEQTFEQDLHHPLNERIRVRANGDELMIRHPFGIDGEKGLVTFDHDHFEGLLPTKTGSKAIIIDMAHSEEFEGPTAFRWIDHDWKAKTSTLTVCSGLLHKK